MLALGTAGLQALRQRGARIVAEVSVGSPVSKDLTHLLVEPPSVRTSVRPLQRTPNSGNVSIQCYNHNNLLSEWKASGYLNNRWQGARVTLKLGVLLPTGQTATVTNAVMDLDDVMLDFSNHVATLICVDAFGRLRRNTINGALAGVTYTTESPTKIAADLIGYLYTVGVPGAGYGSIMDPVSWQAYISLERVSGQTIDYTVPAEEDATSWMQAIELMLAQTNSGIRWNSAGLLEVYRFYPGTGGSQMVLDTALNLSRLTTSKPGGDIENSLTVKRGDGAGGYVETAASPLEDATSITNHGHIGKGVVYDYLADLFADNMAQERLDQKAEAPRIFEMDATLETMVLELWDQVTVIDTPAGLSEHALIFDKAVTPGRGTVRLKAYAFTELAEPWLFTENSQTYDSAQLVW